ncbi:oxidoreductase [Spirochaetia bacterium]|nr:oxidoreductase [Spirochaetia bacterium]
MQYKYLEKTGIQVSRLCLGTMMFGGQTSEADSLSIMDYAFEHGINFFDTADMYNQGESERVTGKGIRGRRERIILATKVFNKMGDDPNDCGLSRRYIIKALDASLQRLDTDYIDIYYLHSPDYRTSLEETLETMSDLVRAGKIHYVGISNYAAWQIADILAICGRRNFSAPIITQNVYNPLTRGIETELVPFVKDHQLSLVVYNPIAAGLLSGKHKPGSPTENTRFSNNRQYYDRYWSDDNFKAVEQLTSLAAQHGLSILELAMKWCAALNQVTSIITGVSRLSQLEQNISILEGTELSQQILDGVDQVWQELPVGTRFAYNR